MKKTDVIIVGAGPAGCFLAKKLAECGLKVVILEAMDEPGSNWEIAIEKSAFGETNLQLPPKKIWQENPELKKYFAINMNNSVEIKLKDDDELIILHKDFNNYLLEKATKAGVTFMSKHRVKNINYDISNDTLEGVSGVYRTKQLFKKELELHFDFKADMIVDASGINSVIRKQLPATYMLRNKIEQEEFVFAWNEVRKVNKSQLNQIEDIFHLKPGMAYLALGRHRAYELMHVKKDNTVGLVFGSNQSKPAVVIAREFLEKYNFFGERIRSAGRQIPLRRALDTMIGDHFACIGDSACQVIPTMGSGVASSMYAADILSKAINKAFNRNDFSYQKLWSYNHRYQSGRGATLASFDIMRRFLQNISHEEIEVLFSSKLLTKEMLTNTFNSTNIRFDVANIFEKIMNLFSRKKLGFGQKLMRAMNDSHKILQLYRNYTVRYDKKAYERWRKKTREIFKKYNKINI